MKTYWIIFQTTQRRSGEEGKGHVAPPPKWLRGEGCDKFRIKIGFFAGGGKILPVGGELFLRKICQTLANFTLRPWNDLRAKKIIVGNEFEYRNILLTCKDEIGLLLFELWERFLSIISSAMCRPILKSRKYTYTFRL